MVVSESKKDNQRQRLNPSLKRLRPPGTSSILRTMFTGGHALAIRPNKTLFMSDTYGRYKSGVKAAYCLKALETGALEDTGIRVVSPSGLLWNKGFLCVHDLQGNKVLKVDRNFKVLQQWSATTPWKPLY